MKNIMIFALLNLAVNLNAMELENALLINSSNNQPSLRFKGHPNFDIRPSSNEQVLLNRVKLDGGIVEFVNNYNAKNKFNYKDMDESDIRHLNMLCKVVWSYREWKFQKKTPDFLKNNTVLTVLLLMPEINSFGCMWVERVNILDAVLALAIQKDDVNALRYLHQRGANIHKRAVDNKTLIHCACKYKSAECLGYLLEHDVDPLCKTRSVTKNGVVTRIARDELEQSLQGSIVSRMYNMLTDAEQQHIPKRALKIQQIKKHVLDGELEKVEEIFEHDSEFINEQDECGWTILMHAASVGNLRMVQLLIKFGARLFLENNQKDTVLAIAKRTQQKDIIDYLEPIITKKLTPSSYEMCLIS